MSNVYKHPAWWQGTDSTQPPEPPDMELTERVAKIEAKLDAILPTLATKADIAATREDMHKEFTVQTWRLVGFVTTICTALTAAVFFIATHT